MEIPIKIKSIMPDRTTYKKYGIEYAPNNLYLCLDIPDKEVMFDNGLDDDGVGTYVVTEAGLKQIVSRLADLVEEIDTEHLKKIGGL